MHRVTIGIPTFNGAARVHHCIQSIQKWADEPDGWDVDIFLVDDGSPDGGWQSMAWIGKHYNVPILFHAHNMGISVSWNDVVRNQHSDVYVLLNDDILVSRHWLTSALYFLERNDKVGTVSWSNNVIVSADVQAVLDADEPLEIYRDPENKRLLHEPASPARAVPELALHPHGSCFAFTRKAWEAVGGFDERYVCFWEEVDFGTMLTEKGLLSYLLPSPVLYHEWSRTFDENAEALNPAKLMNDSRAAYHDKWGATSAEMSAALLNNMEPVEVTWLDSNLVEQSGLVPSK